MAYTTSEAVANFLKRDLTEDEQASLMILIPAIKAWIDLKTDTTFDSTSATTRVYPGGTRIIDIEPCTNVTLVELIDNFGVSNYTFQTYEYVVQPANFDEKTQIEFRYGRTDDGIARIRVTALFSSNDGLVPEDIRMIATRMCGVMLNHKLASGFKKEAIEGHEVMFDLTRFATEDPMVMSVLQLHREIMVDQIMDGDIDDLLVETATKVTVTRDGYGDIVYGNRTTTNCLFRDMSVLSNSTANRYEVTIAGILWFSASEDVNKGDVYLHENGDYYQIDHINRARARVLDNALKFIKCQVSRTRQIS